MSVITLGRLKIDLTGTTQGLLRYIAEGERKNKRTRMVRCACACGGEVVLTYHNYVTGRAKSCGCMKRQVDVEKLNHINGSEELTAKRKKALEPYMGRGKK